MWTEPKKRDDRDRPFDPENGRDLDLPEPEVPLLEGPGEAVSWKSFMRQTAEQTNAWLDRHGHESPPPAWEERFVL